MALASLLVALSLYTTLSSQTGRYAPDNFLEDVVAPGRYLSQQTYLWDDTRGLGKPRSDFSPVTTGFQAAVDTLGTRAWLLERLTHALYLSLAALGAILLMRAFRPRIGVEHAVAAFAYTFCPFTSQFLIPSPYFLYYALAPWFAWIALRGIRDGDPWRWAAAFALALIAVFTFNPGNLFFALVPAALIAIYSCVYEDQGFRRLWSWVWRAGLLGMLICSAGLIFLWFTTPDFSANLHGSELPEDIARKSSWSESWRGLGFWLTYFYEPPVNLLRPQAAPYFTQPAIIAASFLAPMAALVTLALGRWRHRLLFGAMLFVSLVLMVGPHEVAGPSPFGRLLAFAFDSSEIARGLRTTYKAGPGLMLAIAVLLGVGVASAMDAATKGRGGRESARGDRGRLRALVLGVGIPVVVAVGLVLASFPFWTHQLYRNDGFRGIPPYWDRAFSYLEAQAPGRVLVLPGTLLADYRWGNPQDGFFYGLSSLSPVVNRFLLQGTAETSDLVTAIDVYVSSSAYEPGTLAPILKRLGVRWVLLQNDLDWQGLEAPRPSTYDALRTDPGLRLAGTFGQPGQYTAEPDDIGAGLLGERELPPIEVYEVRGAPSPGPRLAAGPPLLVAGGGDSWPALASARMMDGPPIAYTGAASDRALRAMVASGSRTVVTDGNRRRARLFGRGHPAESPTLAAGEPSERTPNDLFGSTDTQSVATYADADWISASRFGFLSPYLTTAKRAASAFDGVERTAWTVQGQLDPGGESITVKLRKPTTVTGLTVLPYAPGPWRITSLDAIFHSQDGGDRRKRLTFRGGLPHRVRFPIEGTAVNEIELRIADVAGPGPVGLAGVGIAEVRVRTPHGPLDLREFVRTPDDLAERAARDNQLRADLATHPPRYELRRVVGQGAEDEETELRREITTFGNHRYTLSATAEVDARTGDEAIDGLLGARVGAVGTSRFNGDLAGSGSLAVDNDFSTGWVPQPRAGERLDLHFPRTTVRSVEVLVLSGSPGGVEHSRVTGVDVAVGNALGRSALRSVRRCVRGGSQARSCLEDHVVHVTPTNTDHLSIALARIQPVNTRFGTAPPEVVEVRINGSNWDEVRRTTPAGKCLPLFEVDGHPIRVRLPRPSADLVAGGRFELTACSSIPLGPGRHRIESLPGLSGAVLTTSLVPIREANTPGPSNPPRGTVDVIDRSPAHLDLRIRAPEGALLIGGMPAHSGWVAQGGELRRTPVPLDTFAAWRVEASTAGAVKLTFEPQRIYELAIALSIATGAWCLWRVTRRRRRETP